MANITDKEINGIVNAINRELDQAYFLPVISAVKKHIPRKELVQEASDDFQNVLDNLKPDQNSTAVQRLRHYKKITDLLFEIPGETFMREEEFTKSLRFLTCEYYIRFESIIKGELYHIAPQKFDLIARKAELELKIEGMSAVGNGSTENLKKLVELSDKYIELVRI